jgi:hypothetical protein
MLLLNTPSDANWAAAQRYAVPTIHLLASFRNPVREYVIAAGAAARARFLPIVQDDKATAPLVAGFSSRGPEPSSGGAVFKPDLAAPGLDIIAAASSKDNTTERDAAGDAYAVLSGAAAGLSVCCCWRLSEVHWNLSPQPIKGTVMHCDLRRSDGRVTPVIARM